MDKYDCLKLENQLCFSLYAVSREVIKRYKPVLDKYNLTYTQYITMLVLWEEGKTTVKKIGQRLHLDSGTLTPLLKRLEQMGLITRLRDTQDDRVVNIELSSKGADLKSELVEVPGIMACSFGMEVDKAVLLKNILDDLLNNLDESK